MNTNGIDSTHVNVLVPTRLQVKVQKLDPRAKIPTKAHETDSGFDLYAVQDCTIPPHSHVRTFCGVAFELPAGYEMQVRGRSGLAGKGIITHFGTVDNGYRGEVATILYNHTSQPYHVKEGDRIGQVVVVPAPVVEMIEVDELSQSNRSASGFGSTGR